MKPTRRRWITALALLVAATWAHGDDGDRARQALMGVDLPARAPQGGMVQGRAPADARVVVAGRTLRQDGGGRFVFGIGRDQDGPVPVEVTLPGSAPVRFEVGVQRRSFAIQRVDGVPQATVTPDPGRAARIAREQGAVNTARTRDDDRDDWTAGFIWPVEGRISGVFGSQRIYNGVPRAFHSGLDVAVPTGTPLRAPAAGVVTFAEADLFLTGGTVLIDHGHGISSNFLHLSRIDVSVGERVEQGQVFGAVGATGRATGPHMHWGMNWFDVRIDPQLLVRPAAAGAAQSAPGPSP
ncbi:MAG: M23 family metallopeptidase [Lysobacteraceae bacterium]